MITHCHRFLTACAVLFTALSCTQAVQPVDFVDPQIGATHCRWFFYTPAAVPMGMAKLAPTTNAYGSYGSWLPNGYDSRHTSIEGFAHLHEFQIGGIVAMPTTGPLKTLPGTLEDPDSGYRSRFDKATEQATAGTYRVTLADYGIDVELTATKRVGYHRYTFPASDKARILFDIGHPQGESAQVVETQIDYLPQENAVCGFVECYPIYATFCDVDNHVRSFFYAKLSKTPQVTGMFRDSMVLAQETHITGRGTGFYAEFSTRQGEQVEMQVGLSFTSVENARANLEAETKGQTFDKVAAAARGQWNEVLSKIKVEGGTHDATVKFYTGLYHALLGRGISSDVDGSYITHDKKIARMEQLARDGRPYAQHNTDGMWGGFWNLTQVWTLAYPALYESYVRSVLDFSRHTQGWLHDGQAAGVYTNGVQTNFQGLVAVAAYNAGILTTDLDYLWDVVYQNDMGYENRPDGAGRFDNEPFVKQGFVPSKNYYFSNGWVQNFGASHTLEYCFSAYAASQLAQSLGKTEEAALLQRYALGYRRLFDPQSGYLRLLEEDGSFSEPFNPLEAWAGFQEGNPAQYTWYVPHDIAGLIDLLGKQTFTERLEKTFSEASTRLYGGNPGEFDSFSGVEQLYNHGNQPCLHNPWLFNYAGKPWLTQYYTRDICEQFYGVTPEHGYGYGQDEDQGQLGAWYVLAAMGLFDVQGGTNANPTMQLGSPQFDKITIQLDDAYYKGKQFVITAANNGPDAYYIQKATLNGQALERCFIPLSAITSGGTLALEMGTEPNTSWGTVTPPPSMSTAP